MRTATVCLLASISTLAGCAMWQETAAPPARVVAEEEPRRIRVTHGGERRRTVMLRPEVRDSALVGVVIRRECFTNAAGSRICRSTRLNGQIALSHITHLEVEYQDAAARGALFGGTAFSAITLAMLFGGGAPCSQYAGTCFRVLGTAGAIGAIWGALIGGWVGRAP
ncbi:MAG: hypothetical protein AAF389_05005 [Gemmatimonadota bacterium]